MYTARETKLLLALLTVAACQHIHRNDDSHDAPASYMILHPSRLSHGSNFTVYVKMLRPVTSESVTAVLQYENVTSKTNVTIAQGSTTLYSGETEGKIDLKVPEREDGRWWLTYMLTVKGSGTAKFENTTWISATSQRDSPELYIFIQTDKGEYKIGQKVRYRVFVVDKNLKPIDPTLDVQIKDPKGNIIVENSNVKSKMGMSGELELSEQPVLGMWLIHAKTREPEHERRFSFSVQEYVLPRYEVKVELPEYGLVKNPELKGKVIAKYTYGKPVKGHVTLRVTKGKGYWWFYEPRAVQTKFEIDGEAEFRIPMDTLLKFDPTLKHDTLYVEANVTETLTGEVRIASNKIRFHERQVWLTFDQKDDYFKPGFRYSTYFKVEQANGRPLATYREQTRISVTYYTDKPVNYRFQQMLPRSPAAKLMEFISPFPGGNVVFMPDMNVPIPANGVVRIDLDIPDGVATGHIEVKAFDERTSKNIQRFRTTSKQYINLELTSKDLKVGDKAEFALSTTAVPTEQLTYYIINERSGKIVAIDYTHVHSKYGRHMFHVTVTADMVPGCRIIVFFYHDRYKEIIADGLIFNVRMTMKNQVNAEFDRRQVSPGSNVSLHLGADSGSEIFVLAVDKRSILQKRGSEITKQSVLGQIGGTASSNGDMYRRMQANDVTDLFMAAGLTMKTDSNTNDFNLWELKGTITDQINRRYGQSCPTCAPPGSMYDVNEMDSTSWSGNAAGNVLGQTTVRHDFPETWIWTNQTVGSSGRVDIHAEVPDTITEWQATAFALNEESGLGVVSQSTNLTVFLPFFVSLQLPFSIVSGEIVIIQALVFNYHPYDMYVTVTLKNTSNDFVGIRVNHYKQEEEVEGVIEKCIFVKSDSAETTHFMIKAVTIGTIDLEVEATSQRGSDTVRRELVVKPPGKEEEDNMAKLITLEPKDDTVETDMSVFYPPGIVPGSQRIRFTVIGDIFGPSLENLEHLVQMPDGCGEQNMVHFAPAVFAARYLNVTNRYHGEAKTRVTRAMSKGYQRELLFQRKDGSFSAFGERDSSGSLWLTSFVVKSFAGASSFIYVDPSIVEKAVNYTLTYQNRDGSFDSTGNIISKTLQGSSASSTRALAAYVLIALKEVQDAEIMRNATLIEKLRQGIMAAWSYVHKNKDRMSSDYEKAIASYALSLMKRGGVDEMFDTLNRSRYAVNKDGLQYWRNDMASTEVEIASYVLLVHAQKNAKAHGLPVLRWLLNKRNPFGGFVSTQDTVVALQALAEFAAVLYSGNDMDLNVTLTTATGENDTVSINMDNRDVLQIVDIPSEQGRISVNASGQGMALIESSVFYTVLDEMRNPSFSLSLSTESSDTDRFTVRACARWMEDRLDSGMTLIEVDFPSGFEPETPLRELKKSPLEKKREIQDGRFVVYFDELPSTEQVCVSVVARRVMVVAKYQPAYARVYSYYDTDKSAMKMYLPSSLNGNSICDVCGMECGCEYNPEAVPMNKCKSTSYSRVGMPFYTSAYKGSIPTRTLVYPDSKQLITYPSWTRRRTVRLGNQWNPPSVPLFRRVWRSHSSG